MSTTDPLGIITNPPSNFIKVHGTSREDINGNFGLAVQFDASRGRYMIQMVAAAAVASQQMSAFKPDNIVKASTIESYQAQFQLLRNDPNVQRQLQQYYSLAQSKLPAVIKPEYAAGGVGVLFVGLMYLIGVSKTLMLLSTILLLGMIVGPDLMAPNMSPQTVATNFPRRCRETIEQSAPDFVKGKVSNNIAVGIVIAMVLFAGTAVFMTPNRAAASMPPPVVAAAAAAAGGGSGGGSGMLSVEQAYKLGFDDATVGKEFGSSMTTTSIIYNNNNNNNYLDDEYNNVSAPPPPAQTSSSSFGFSHAMAIFFLYRTATELGGNPMNGSFSIQRLVANAKTMEPWRMGILGFSIYNLVKGFI
jgi:hypothetical protein